MAKIICPACGSTQSRVLDSYPCSDCNGQRRHRICDVCGKKYYTIEGIEKENRPEGRLVGVAN